MNRVEARRLVTANAFDQGPGNRPGFLELGVAEARLQQTVGVDRCLVTPIVLPNCATVDWLHAGAAARERQPSWP